MSKVVTTTSYRIITVLEGSFQFSLADKRFENQIHQKFHVTEIFWLEKSYIVITWEKKTRR